MAIKTKNNTPVLTCQVPSELERTPEAVAVSRNGQGALPSAWSKKSPKVARLFDEVTGRAPHFCPSVKQTLGGGRGAKPPASSYKDSLAKSATVVVPVANPVAKSACGGWAVVSECSTGKHHFAKKLLCGKEWCGPCGEDNSGAHKRRQARILPKLQQVRRLGYLVIEWPEWARHIGQGGISPDLDGGEHVAGWVYSKVDLRATTNMVVEVLAGKRCGRRGRVGGYFGRGIHRWHWFGDELPGKWNPHLNVLVDFDSLYSERRQSVQSAIIRRKVELQLYLVMPYLRDWVSKYVSEPEEGYLVEDTITGRKAWKNSEKKARRELRGIACYEAGTSGYMPKPLLEAIQAALRAALLVPDLIVHYSYFDRPGQIVQKARYVTRATFRHYGWNEYMADELWNFRNIRWWGDWKDLKVHPEAAVWQLADAEKEGEDVNGLEAVASLQSGICPDCGQPLKVLHRNPKTGKPVCWTRPVDSVYLGLWQAQEISGTGYYRIPHREWTGCSFSPGELLRREEMEAKARASPSVRGVAVLARKHLKHKLQAAAEGDSDDSGVLFQDTITDVGAWKRGGKRGWQF